MNKKFRVRTKQSSSRRAARPGGTVTSIKSTSKKSLMDRIHEFARTTEAPEVVAFYDSIFGIGRPLDDLVASNQHLLKAMRPLLLSDFEAYLNAQPSRVGREVTRIAVTRGSNADFPIPDVRKAASIYKRAGVDVISTVRFRPVADDGDPNGFAFAVELYALIFGDSAEGKLLAKSRRSRRGTGLNRSRRQWIEPHNTEAIRAAVRGLFSTNYTSPPIEDSFVDLAALPDWSDKNGRNLRAYITMMARAQLPLKYMLVLNGAGGPILARALAEMQHALKESSKDRPPVIHRDGVAHFFFSELRRLGLDDISVPLVRLR